MLIDTKSVVPTTLYSDLKVLRKPETRIYNSCPRYTRRSHYAVFCVSFENFSGSQITKKHNASVISIFNSVAKLKIFYNTNKKIQDYFCLFTFFLPLKLSSNHDFAENKNPIHCTFCGD